MRLLKRSTLFQNSLGLLAFFLSLFITTTNGFLSQRNFHGTIGVGRLHSSAGPQSRVQAIRKSLADCVCLVTGASRGIGKAIAIELGKEGAVVYITGTSSTRQAPAINSSPWTTNEVVGGPGTIEETASLVTEAGGVGIPVYCDHGNDENVRRLFEQISIEYDRLDILVNNAFRIPSGGVQELKGGRFWETGVSGWDAMHAIGLRSHFVASALAIPLMIKARERPRGKLPRPFIAMISSFGAISYTFSVSYGVAKAATDRLAKDMAVELKDEDICVVSFWPGLVYTERTQIAQQNGEWEKYVGLPLTETETPAFTGKAIKGVALDEKNMLKTGTYQVVAELAEEYGFTDENGKRPPSVRSLRFLLPNYVWDEDTRNRLPSWIIPDIKLPFWMMSQPPPK